MGRHVQLTGRDRDLSAVLAAKVRIMSDDQIARTWWHMAEDPKRAARVRIMNLARSGYLVIERAPVHPELDFTSPMTSWQPGLEPPYFGALSNRLQKRWDKQPIMMTIVAASRASASLLGRHGGRLSREVERTHDLHLARVYLLYRAQDPSLLKFWIFEEQLRQERGRTNEMLPDVIIRADGNTRALEFGGAYSKQKLQAFHDYCAERRLPYEIW